MSVSFSQSKGFISIPRQSSSTETFCQASIPLISTNWATFSKNWGCTNGSPVFLCLRMGIGVPQDRCLEIHQSGLALIIEVIRVSPWEGIHWTFLILAKPIFRRVRLDVDERLSIEINHCSVARNRIGVLVRQQCGYECLRGSSAYKALWVFNLLRIISFALNTLMPTSSSSFTWGKYLPSDPTYWKRPRCWAVLKSSTPWSGAVCTMPVPVSEVTCSPIRNGDGLSIQGWTA